MNADNNSLTKCDSMALSMNNLYPPALGNDNAEISVCREENEVRTDVSFPTSCIIVNGDGPVNLSFNYNVTVDASTQEYHDDRVIRNTENNTTVACGDSAISAIQDIGRLVSNLFDF